MKSSEYFFSPLRRKVTLNIRDNQNQNSQEYHDFDSIVDKELNTTTNPACRV